MIRTAVWTMACAFAASQSPVASQGRPGALRTWLDTRAATEFSGVALIVDRTGDEVIAASGEADRTTHIANTPDTRFNVGSINKTFTAIAIAQLVEAGRLSYRDRLAAHLPDYPNKEAASQITIHQLLTHRSGVASFPGTRFRTANTGDTVADLVRVVAAEPLAFEPGTRQQYSNGGYVLLGRVVEIVSGQRYDEYVSEHVFKVAGMADTAFTTPGTAGVAIGYAESGANTSLIEKGNPAGGGYSSARDLARFARALAEGKLLGPKMTKYLLHDTLAGIDGEKFGYALREQTAGTRRFVGNGGGAPGVNAEFRLEPDTGLIVVVLANSSPPSATRLLQDILAQVVSR